MALHRRKAVAQDEGMRQRPAHEKKHPEENSQKMPKVQHFQQQSQPAARSNRSPQKAQNRHKKHKKIDLQMQAARHSEHMAQR